MMKLNTIKIPSIGMASVHADRMGFPSAHKGGLPGWVKEHLVCWYDVAKQGITNESMRALPESERKLTDFSGHGLDMGLFGIDWDLGSGVGTEAFDFRFMYFNKTFNLDASKSSKAKKTFVLNTNVNKNTNIAWMKKIAYSDGIIKSGEHGFKFISDKGYRVLCDLEPNSQVKCLPLTDEELNGNILIQSKDDLKVGDIFTIEQIPNFEGYIVFDGKKSYGVSKNQPLLDDYTVIYDRVYVSRPDMGQATFSSKSAAAGQGAFINEIIETSGGVQVYSFGNRTALIDFPNDYFGYQTKDEYNGMKIQSSPKKPDTNALTIGTIREGDARFSNVALKSYFLFDISLTPDQIEWVKTHLMHYVPADTSMHEKTMEDYNQLAHETDNTNQ